MAEAEAKAFEFLNGPIVSLITAGLGCALFVSGALHFVSALLMDSLCAGAGSIYMVISLYLAGHGIATMAVMLPEGGKLEKVSKLVTGTITMYEFHGTRAMYYGFWNVLFNASAYGLGFSNLIDAFKSMGDGCAEKPQHMLFYYIDQAICLGFWIIMAIEIFLWFKKEKGTSS